MQYLEDDDAILLNYKLRHQKNLLSEVLVVSTTKPPITGRLL